MNEKEYDFSNNSEKIKMDAITRMIVFSEEEDDAFEEIIPMTQQLFNSSMDKCNENFPNLIFTSIELMKTYPVFYREYKRNRDINFDIMMEKIMKMAKES